MADTTEIICPNCGQLIDINEALSHEAEERLQREYEQKLEQERKRLTDEQSLLVDKARRKEREELETRMKALQDEVQEKSDALRRSKDLEVQLLKAQRTISEQQEEMKLAVEKGVLEARGKIEDQVRRSEKERHELQLREMQHKLDQANKVADELKRKMEQGSQQLSGEVQELAIEEYLRAEFPLDVIEEIAKGQRGGDCLHVVHADGKPLGTIYYESKRTKAFQSAWVEKLREDMRSKGADVGVIVTETMPKDMERFGQVQGIWICTYAEFKALSHVLREMVARVAIATDAQKNRGDKMAMLYDYLTGPEFRLQVESIVDGFQSMQQDLSREKVAMEKIWKQREKQIEKVLRSTSGLFGSIKGIAGADVGDVGLLEL